MSSTIQQDFIDSIQLRSIDRVRHCGEDLKPSATSLIERSEIVCFLYNRFRLSVRIRNPHAPAMENGSGLPFSDMNAPCVSRAGIAIYSWKNGSVALHQVAKHSVMEVAGPENA
ncbi:hypothetical protein OIU34_28260 [Pararhizobium sp. BT-229]|uniref:hypothetical protein n=1 Tax=Pararhizobium sp. BT-229 TaxID=2986923 RepID=UPI0021F6A7A7|nr:hypothetical protein [Pararhizobium sp. BT-229]MCV9965769.1 hypothetical protein [Pararhizobium sp. BT-229]